MAPSKFAASWKKPYTSIYNDNYLFGFNFYEDMMTWLDKRSTGVQEPAPHLPSVPETAFKKFARKKTGGPTPEEEMAAAVQRTHDRIERMVPRSRSREGYRAGALRKVRSVGAFTTKAIAEIEEEMRNEAMAAQDDLLVGRRRRRTPLVYDRELQSQSLSERRAKIEEDDGEVDERMKSVGLRLSHAMERSEKVLQESVKSETSYIRDQSRLDELLSSPLPTSPQPHSLSCCPSEWELKCKQYQIEIEQLNSRLVEAEARLKTEITRIEKKFQVQITELEMSLDVANKNNIELQKTIKRQALQITELQNHYDEVQRQLQSTIDQYGIAQRRAQALQAELDEFRGSLEAALRAKRAAEQQYEEAHSRVNELTTINVNISAIKSKLEGELSAIQADFDELHKELKIADERANKAQSELKHTVEILHEEQERVVKIETIRKTLEVEVKTLTVRLEEVEANALAGGKRVISKLEARIRDVEIEMEEEKRRHAETIKVLRKKERHVKELYIQSEESQKTVTLLTDQVEKLNEKIKMYKRQLNEQEGMSNQSLQRVRGFQRELEAAEDGAEHAESNLSFIRAKHRSWVTGSQVPGATKQVYVVEEHRHEGF